MGNQLTLTEEVMGLRTQFEDALCEPGMKFDAEAQFAIQQIYKSDYNIKLAQGNRQAVRDAVINVAGMGLTLNPAMKYAYLAPRDKQLQLLISYMGLVHLAISSGSVLLVVAEIVYEKDKFKLNGVDREPTHEFDAFAPIETRGEMIGVYVVAKTAAGDYITTRMTIDEVWDVRDRSESWKSYWATRNDAKPKKSPWVSDEAEMIRKTVIKRGYKLWPRSDRLAKAIDHLNTKAGEGIELTASGHETAPGFSLKSFLDRINDAQDMHELNLARRAGQSMASSNNDKASYDTITKAAQERKRQISSNNGDVTDVQEKAK